MVVLNVNGKAYETDVEPETPLLWVLRDTIGLTGTKYGCGIAQCGACTVHVDGVAMRSCSLPIGMLAGKQITTIEVLEKDGNLHSLQTAFLETGAMQCGYCTSGMILSGVALLNRNADPNEGEIVHAMQGNVCRCGTYPRIVAAVRLAAQRRTS